MFHSTKKFLVLAAASVLLSSAFAENSLHFGLDVPYTVEYNPSGCFADFIRDYDDIPIKSTDELGNISSIGAGFDFAFVHASRISGYTYKFGIDYAGLTSYIPLIDQTMEGFQFTLSAGFGYTLFIRENFLVQITGNFGIKITSLYNSFLMEARNSFSHEINDYDIIFNYVNFFLGPEVSVSYRFNNHVGIYGSLYFGYMKSNCDFSIENVTTGNELEAGFDSNQLTLQPKIGLEIIF